MGALRPGSPPISSAAIPDGTITVDDIAPGTNGYILRTASGAVAWRELSATGLLADRPSAASGREGQTYWVTDAAAGLELSECVHQGASYAWVVRPYGVTATGALLVQAANAAAARTALGLGTLATQNGTFSGTSSGTNTGDQTLTSLGVSAFVQTLLTDANAAAVRTTIGAGTSSVAVSSATPQPNGVAAAGSSPDAARADHVHEASAATVEAADITDSTTVGRAQLTAATVAAQREAMGVPIGTYSAPLFATGQGWTLVDATTAAYGEPTLESGNLGRVTITAGGNVYNLAGPRIEREITYRGPAWWRIRATPAAASITTTNCLGGIYVRGSNVAGGHFELAFLDAAGGDVQVGGWSAPGSGLTSDAGANITFGSGAKLQIVALGTTLHLGYVTAAGVWTQVATRTMSWIPTHVGIFGAADSGWSGRIDFSDFEVTSLG